MSSPARSARGAAPMRNLAEAGLLAVVAVGVLLDSRSYPGSLAEGAPGPAFFPRLLAVLLLGCAVWLAVRARPWSPRPEASPPVSDPTADPDTRARRRVRLGLAAAWIAVFLFVWPWLGTVLSIPLLVAGLMWLTGERSRVALVAVPIGFAGFIYLVFMVALGVPLPTGF